MKRAALALFLATVPTLHAQEGGDQIWEGRQAIIVPDPLLHLFRGGSDALALQRFDGARRTRLEKPPQSRMSHLAYWKGAALAYGPTSHPAWLFPDLGKRHWSFPADGLAEAWQRQEHHLWVSRDFRTWSRLGRYRRQEDPHTQEAFGGLHPLEDGAYLALPNRFGHGRFWAGDRVSPVARYRVDEKSRLVFDALIALAPEGPWKVVRQEGEPEPRLVLLPGYEDLEDGRWNVSRSPAGLLLVHGSGRSFLLDNHDGHLVRSVRVPPPAKGRRQVLRVQPTPDGHFVMASLEVPEGPARRWMPGRPKAGATPSARLASALLASKGSREHLVAFFDAPPPLVWHRIDPETGHIQVLPPPPGAPPRIEDRTLDLRFTFAVQADGSMKVLPRPQPRSGLPW